MSGQQGQEIMSISQILIIWIDIEEQVEEDTVVDVVCELPGRQVAAPRRFLFWRTWRPQNPVFTNLWTTRQQHAYFNDWKKSTMSSVSVICTENSFCVVLFEIAPSMEHMAAHARHGP